jgi:hypothetical protein
LPDFPDVPKQVLSVKSTIVKDLEYLREQQRLAKIYKKNLKTDANPL